MFGWEVGGEGDRPKLRDASGHVIGHFVVDQAVAGEAGIRPYVYVESVEATIGRIEAQGGEVVAAPYPEGDLTAATFRDPAGNVLGIWQRGSG